MTFYHKPSKYVNWYFSIINSARSRHRSKKTGYFENHHIHPDCLGGTRSKENMVLLTAREHIICHRLLIRMFDRFSPEWCSMVFAFKRMIDHGSKHAGERTSVINTRHIEERRKLHSKAMSITMTGRTMPDHVRKAISKHNSGRTLSQEHRAAISESLKKTLDTPEQRQKISAERKSRTYKDEQRVKASEGMKRVWAARNALKPVLMLPGRNTPEEKKALWRLRISLAQIGKKTKPVTEELKKKRSESMKAVWAARRAA